MSQSEHVFVAGIGAVSPAGWGVGPLREALAQRGPLPVKDLLPPGWTRPMRIRQVPAPSARPAFAAHARLRRTSPIAHHAVAAALEALGEQKVNGAAHTGRLGVIFCSVSGCVNYSRRFYDEVLKEPATASPLVFPETVYNSAASHLASLLGTTAISYTLVGDPATFLQGIALAADWLLSERVDGCLVIGAEEMDWIIANALRLFDRNNVLSDGAGALYLRREASGAASIELTAITDPHLFSGTQPRARAAQLARADLRGSGTDQLLCDGLSGSARSDRDEENAWRDWAGPRLSPKRILGEGLMAASAWQCVAAVDALRQDHCRAATVSVVGVNQQSIAAQFARF